MALTRRKFLLGAGIISAAAVSGISAELFLFAPRRITVEETWLSIKDLPSEFAGFGICQITDTHHGPYVGLDYIKEVVTQANRLNPDLVVLTGDYVSENKSFLEPVMRVLSGLKARHGIMSVLGNHDYWVGEGHSIRALKAQEIPLLKNTHSFIEINGARLCIAGVGDLTEDRPDVARALYGVDTDVPRVVLCHNPDYTEELPDNVRVDLMLSGHTHGGQVRMPFTGRAPVVPSEYGQKYAGGLVRRGETQIYVSRGIGVSIMPIRFNCPPEISFLRLKRA